MKRAFFTLLCMLLFYSCGLFQKTQTSTRKSAMKSEEASVKNAEMNTRNQSVGWSITTINDSLNSSSRVVIWPKGEFDFSPVTGFRGMAEKVVLTETSKFGAKVMEEHVKLEEENKTVLLKEQHTKTMSDDQKEKVKETKSQWWFLLLILVFLFLLWALRNVLKLNTFI